MKELLKKVGYRWFQFLSTMQRAIEVQPTFKNLSLCCVFKNEAPFLKEWIDFHLNQGFEKFYLINNSSTDAYREVLQPYIKEGIVKLSNSLHNGMSTMIQAKEFNRAMRNIMKEEGEHCWVAFVDIDEYLFSTEGVPVKKILSNFTGKQVAGILVNWLMFGTSSLKTLNGNSLMVKQLIRRAPLEHDEHRIFKSIVYLANAYRFFEGPHRPIAKGESQFYYSNGQVFDPSAEPHIHDPLRINHYWYRSEKYYYQQKLQKRKAFGDIRKRDLEEWHFKKCNEVLDMTILERLP